MSPLAIRGWKWGGFIALAVLLASWVILGSPWGLGLSPDSLSYVHAARSLGEHGNLDRFPALRPPLYPIILAGLAQLDGDVLQAARWWSAAMLFCTSLLLSWLLLRSMGHYPLALALSALVALHPDLVQAHLALWSEATFLPLVLLNVLLLQRCLADALPWRLVVALGLLMGAAVLVRYAGLFLVAVNVVGIVFYAGSASGMQRIRAAAASTGIALAAPMAWLWIKRASVGGGPEQLPRIHWPEQWHIVLGEQTLAGWFGLPVAWGGWVLLAVLLAAGLALLTRGELERGATLRPLLAVHLLSYLALLFASLTLAYANTPLDGRILLPVFPLAIILLASAFERTGSRWLAAGLGMSLVAALAFCVERSGVIWQQSRDGGIGLASQAFKRFPIIEALGQLPNDWTCATNGGEILALHTRLRSMGLPQLRNPMTKHVNLRVDQQIDALATRADAIVHFSMMAQRDYLPSVARLDRAPGFTAVYAGKDGVVWVRDTHLDLLRALRAAPKAAVSNGN